MTQVAQRIIPAAPLQPSIQRMPALVSLLPVALLTGVALVLVGRWWNVASEVAAPSAGGMLTLPLTDFLFQLPGYVVFGLLFVRAVTMPAQRTAASQHLMGMAARWSYVWAASTLAFLAATASELTGTAVLSLWTREDVFAVLARDDRAQSQIAMVWVALVIALFGARLSSRLEVGALLVLATAVILPSVQKLPPNAPAHAAGHAVGQGLHWLAMAALAVQVLAAVVWLGGLLAVALHLRAFPLHLRRALPGFGDAATLCVLLVGAAGLVQSTLALPGLAALWQTTPGLVIVAKGLALVLLTAVGYRHRRRTIAVAGTGHLLPLLLLVAGELVLMGATVTIALLLTATA